MKLHFFAILVSSLFLFSCKKAINYTKDDSQLTIIHSPQNMKDLQVAKYSEVFDSIKIVPLESPDSALIGRIDKILIHNDKIFILDQVERKAVLEFDMNGRFIRRYGRIGRGPGQYLEPNDMSVNDKELTIWVSDQRKFIIYDLNGNVLREVRTGTLAKSGVQLDKDQFALYLDIGGDVATDEKFDLKIFDNYGENTYVGLEKKNKYFSKGSFFFSQYRNHFLVSPGYSNDIYEINPNSDTIRKKYTIDFGKYKMPEDFPLKYVTQIKFQHALEKSTYAALSNYWETPGYLAYSFVYKGLVYDAYYSKSTGEIKYGNAWFNNVHGIFSGINKGAYDDNIISFFDPADVASYQKSFTSIPTAKQLDTTVAAANKYYGSGTDKDKFVAGDFTHNQEEIDMLQSIKASDNPVILIKRLKHF